MKEEEKWAHDGCYYGEVKSQPADKACSDPDTFYIREKWVVSDIEQNATQAEGKQGEQEKNEEGDSGIRGIKPAQPR